eukprot:scaffold12169_cov132-Cylindrotheca_fusiformis.AAC.6
MECLSWLVVMESFQKTSKCRCGWSRGWRLVPSFHVSVCASSKNIYMDEMANRNQDARVGESRKNHAKIAPVIYSRPYTHLQRSDSYNCSSPHELDMKVGETQNALGSREQEGKLKRSKAFRIKLYYYYY